MKLTVEDKNLSGVLDGAWGKLAKKSICSRPDVKLNVSVMLASCVTDVRDAIDGDGDGEISKEEFVKNAMGSKFISDLLS